MDNTDRLIDEIIKALDSTLMVVDIGDVNDILCKQATLRLDDAAFRLISVKADVPLGIKVTWKDRLHFFIVRAGGRGFDQ